MSTATTIVAQTLMWNKPDVWRPKVLSVLRIVVCFVFAEHGIQKLLGLPHASFPMPAHLPPLFLQRVLSRPSVVCCSCSAYSPGQLPSFSVAKWLWPTS
jgi:hypothetical protein